MTNFHATAATSKPIYIGCLLAFSIPQYTQNFLARKSELHRLTNEPKACFHWKYTDKENTLSAKPCFYWKGIERDNLSGPCEDGIL